MCKVKTPKIDGGANSIPVRQPALAPDQGAIQARSVDRERRRFGMAATILHSRHMALAPANVTAKNLLGQ